ncbi:hypothetical protein K443DRAFT_69367, partial [Laccaria amethystina LaAM-08-1]
HATRASRMDCDDKQHVFCTDVVRSYPPSKYYPPKPAPLRFLSHYIRFKNARHFLNSDTLSICSTTAAN